MSTVPAPERRLEYLRLDDVVPALRNPKLHAQEKVEASMARFGFTNPVLMDERTGRLVAGHGRLEALRGMQARGEPAPNGILVLAGTWMIPVTRGWSSKDDREAEAYLLADNQLTTAGGWDDEQLAAMLRELDAADVDVSKLGWAEDDLKELLADPAPKGAEDPGPREPLPEAVSVVGEVYELGPHRLLCGDATDQALVAKLFGHRRAALVATDPPYGIDYSSIVDSRENQRAGGWDDIINDALSPEDMRTLIVAAFGRARWASGPGCAVLVWHPDLSMGEVILAALREAGMHQHKKIVWVKPTLVFGRHEYHWRHEPAIYGWWEGSRALFHGERSETTVWEVDPGEGFKVRNGPAMAQGGLGLHPTQKPVELFARAIRNHTLAGEVVYDPFLGSGSTLIAAAKEGRVCCGAELKPHFADVIRKRWGDFARSAGIDPGPGAL